MMIILVPFMILASFVFGFKLCEYMYKINTLLDNNGQPIRDNNGRAITGNSHEDKNV